jgi:conjugal transfer pilus assembly protein TraE
METDFQFHENKKVIQQRNILGAIAGGSLLLNLCFGVYSVFRSETVILQPVLQSPLTLTSSRVSRDYLELVTRDTAIAILNRSPQSLDYWMNNVLKITDPSAYGAVKAKLLDITGNLRGSDITQSFEPHAINVDPDNLHSEMTGVLHVYVGQREVSQANVRYRFDWTYRGLSLRLAGFGLVQDGVQPTTPEQKPNPNIERGGE